MQCDANACMHIHQAQHATINEAQKCPSGEVPLVFVLVGTPGGHPPMRNKTLLGPYQAP